MGLGYDHYMKIMTELHKRGMNLTLDEVAELNKLCKEIDRVHQQIMDNQAAFGVPKITVKDALKPDVELINGWLKEKCRDE